MEQVRIKTSTIRSALAGRNCTSGSAMKVGELARKSGVSVRTLHHYGAIGFLPLPARNRAGHRVYGAPHIAV
jgi:hypothetical protein